MTDAPPTREKKKPARTARTAMMDLLARRDHSEMELRKKLSEKFEADDVEKALQDGRDNGWLLDGRVLAERFAAQLSRRGKGILAINHKLLERGLPAVTADDEEELEKALRLIETQLSGEGRPDSKERERLGRFLLSRGFEPSIVRKVVYEKL